MKKYLLFILAICAAFTANAQMATTYKNGTKNGINGPELVSRLVSADDRNICFRTVAKRLYADLNPATHNVQDLNTDANDPDQINFTQGGWSMAIDGAVNGFSSAQTKALKSEQSLRDLTYYQISGGNAASVNPVWNVSDDGSIEDPTIYGNENVTTSNYVNLTDYEELRIYPNSKGDKDDFLAFFFNADGSNYSTINSTSLTWKDNYYAIDLTQQKMTGGSNSGRVFLIAIKGPNANTGAKIKKITVCNYSYTTINGSANCSYTYDADRKVGTFSFTNVLTGEARVNLFDGLKGKLSVDNFENFVIRTLNVTTPYKGVAVQTSNGSSLESQTARYCIEFCDENHQTIHEAYIYSEDMKIIPLKEFFKTYNGVDQFDAIDEVWIKAVGGGPTLCATVQIAEAYFITPYDLNRGVGGTEYPLGEYFYDMDDAYIGNAYIHPSYFMMSNGVNFDDETGVVSMDMNVYSYLDLNKTMYTNQDICLFRVGALTQGSGSGNDRFIYGVWDGNIPYTEYTDLQDYAKMYVSFDKSKDKPCIIFNFDTGVDALKEINSSNYTTDFADCVTEYDGLWVIDIQRFKEKYGNAHLSFIKAPDDGQALVSSVLLEKIQKRGKAAGQVDVTGRISLSVPFSGFDMSDVTIVSMDNAEDGDVIGSWITGYEDYFSTYRIPDVKKQNKENGSQEEIFLAEDNHTFTVVRQLYESRYYGEFKPASDDGTRPAYDRYKNQINFMTWHTKNDKTYSMTLYNICITKNHVIARNGGNHTKLNSSMYNKDVTNNIGSSVEGGAALIYGTNNFDKTGEDYADLGDNFYKMQIKGTPNKEIVMIFNCDLDEGIGSFNPEYYRETFVRLDSKGLAVVDLKDIYHKDDNNCRLNRIMTPWGATGATKIDYIKLYGEEDGIIELNSELYHTWTRDENTTVTREIGRKTYTQGAQGESDGGAFVNNIGNNQNIGTEWYNNTIFGSGYKFFKENYAELTGYKTIRVWGDQGMTPRIIYNCSDDEREGVAQRFEEMSKTIGEEGYVDFDIRNFIYFHLNSIKNAGTEGKVSKIELISDERIDYVLEGNGTLSENATEAAAVRHGGTNAIPFGSPALEAINDVGARVIDTRPRVNLSRANLAYPGNPNCIFLMRHYLSLKQAHRVPYNTPNDGNGNDANMVLIYGTADNDGATISESDEDYYNANYQIKDFEANNIKIFDGFPFSAPRDIKIKSASLTRKTKGEKVGTLILPFDADITAIKGRAFNTTTSKYAEYDVKKQGILEDTDIKKGDHVLLFEEHTGAIKAYWPYLYVANSDNDALVIPANATEIKQTPEVGTEDAPAEYMTNEAQANEQGQRHYLRGFMESTHVENAYGYNTDGQLLHAANATVAPFRVMIQSPQDINTDIKTADQLNGNVKIAMASDFLDDETPTEIQNVQTGDLNAVVNVYGANGVLIKKNVKAADALNNLPKGVYVVDGKKIVK